MSRPSQTSKAWPFLSEYASGALLPANHMCWYVTERCNYACKFCFRYQEGNRTLSPSEARDVVGRLHALGISRITFTGEPLLVDWIFEVLEYARSLGMYATLMTNGSLLDIHSISNLSKVLDRLSLPLVGSTEAMNVRMTMPPGHFDRVCSVLESLANSAICVKVTTVVTSANWRDVPSIAGPILRFGVPEWKLYHFRPNRGDALANAARFEISYSDFAWAVSRAMEATEGRGVQVTSISLQDRFTGYLLMRPNGSLELATGDGYYRLGNVLACCECLPAIPLPVV